MILLFSKSTEVVLLLPTIIHLDRRRETFCLLHLLPFEWQNCFKAQLPYVVDMMSQRGTLLYQSSAPLETPSFIMSYYPEPWFLEFLQVWIWVQCTSLNWQPSRRFASALQIGCGGPCNVASCYKVCNTSTSNHWNSQVEFKPNSNNA